MRRKINVFLNPTSKTKFNVGGWKIENGYAAMSFDLDGKSYCFTFGPTPVLEIWKDNIDGQLDSRINKIKLKDLTRINGFNSF
jgi:hypothetical protein